MRNKKELYTIISAFPGTGKTFVTDSNIYYACDSDSSQFSWDENGNRNPDFPKNYIHHIKEQNKHYDFVFVSSHKEVREALIQAGMEFICVFPDKSSKDVYKDSCLADGIYSIFSEHEFQDI